MTKTFSLNIYGLIFSIMLLVAGLTWVLPSGQYDTVEKDGRTYTVAGSYHTVQSNPQGLAVLMAPAKGFSQCADIIASNFNSFFVQNSVIAPADNMIISSVFN